MPTASTVLVESAPAAVPPAPTVPPLAPLLPPPRGDELGPNGRRALIGGVVAAHFVGGWALLQIDAVRDVVRQAAPTIMVNMVAPPEPPKPKPEPPPPTPQPKKAVPAPAPVIAAAPTPTPSPPAFVAPEPVPAPPQPVNVVPSPPAPPAPAAQPPAPPAPKLIPSSALRYIKEPPQDYPLLSRRAKETGAVTLRITVDANGRLKEAVVQKSSGFERLDQAALQGMRKAVFAPYMENGKAIEVQALATVDYSF